MPFSPPLSGSFIDLTIGLVHYITETTFSHASTFNNFCGTSYPVPVPAWVWVGQSKTPRVYILIAPEGFRLPNNISVMGGIIGTFAVFFVIFKTRRYAIGSQVP